MDFFSSLFEGAMKVASSAMSEGGIYDPGRAREYSYNEIDDIPREMGTYRFFEKTNAGNKLWYIGVTQNLHRRVREHKSKGEKFKPGEYVAIKIANTGTTWDELINHERKKISQHNPGRNGNSGGGGRRPEDLDTD